MSNSSNKFIEIIVNTLFGINVINYGFSLIMIPNIYILHFKIKNISQYVKRQYNIQR